MPEISPIALKQLTTLRVGAAPVRMFEAHTRDELVADLLTVWGEEENWFVLGGGSNLFVGDEPYDGAVVLIRTSGITEIAASDAAHRRFRVEAGHDWDTFVRFTIDEGLAGVEAMSGIPGSVGATPIQNVGAYGQEVSQTLVEVELVDFATGEVSVVSASDLDLGVRTSVLKRHQGEAPERDAVVLSATFELADVGDGPFAVSPRVRQAITAADDELLTLADVRSRVLAVRRGKGMVLDPEDSDTISAGSFFENPILSAAAAETLPPACPRYPLTAAVATTRVVPLDHFDGYVPPTASQRAPVKVSAAWLIENSGVPKGFKLPKSRAAISQKHTLALTNRNLGTAEEVAELARYVRAMVHSEFGILLQPEPVTIGVEL